MTQESQLGVKRTDLPIQYTKGDAASRAYNADSYRRVQGKIVSVTLEVFLLTSSGFPWSPPGLIIVIVIKQMTV